jgi:PPM family protein phosphatase
MTVESGQGEPESMLKVMVGNAQHIGARQEQQDSFAFSKMGDKAFAAHGGLLGVVADGMGGLEGGRQASSVAVDAFMAAYNRKTAAEAIPIALHRSLLEANRAVVGVSRQIGTEGNTGTTLAAVVVHNDLLYWIAAGDTRVYLLRDGYLARVNADHSYATSLWPQVASGALERESALNDSQAQHLTSHLGMDDVARIDLSLRPFPLQGEDVVIVCSDGIYRAASEDEIEQAFRRATSVEACEAIQAGVLAKARSKQDNLTIIAMQCRDTQPVVLAAPTPRKRISPLLVGALSAEILVTAGLGAFYVGTHWQPISKLLFAHEPDNQQGKKQGTPQDKQQDKKTDKKQDKKQDAQRAQEKKKDDEGTVQPAKGVEPKTPTQSGDSQHPKLPNAGAGSGQDAGTKPPKTPAPEAKPATAPKVPPVAKPAQPADEDQDFQEDQAASSQRGDQ